MLSYLSRNLSDLWGPLRLFGSNVFLMALGTLTAAILVQRMLPRLWHRLPKDHGKAILGPDGMKSEGKHTGAGYIVTLLALPIYLLAVPWTWAELGAIAFLFFAMACGYLDDRAQVPWGQLKKGLLDAVAAIGVAACLYIGMVKGTGQLEYARVWFPFWKGMVDVAWYVYIPSAAFFLWFIMNVTNCSDGVDGLAGTLTIVTLACLAAVLYLVIGNTRTAHYFLIDVGGTASRCAARWAVMLMTSAGAFAGYLWWNAEPSKVLMGDAGSRFLGLLAGAGALATGNPLLIIAFMPVVIVNGGAGLAKLVLLRGFKKMGADVRPPREITEEERKRQNVIVRAVWAIRCPLHDHCKRNLKWSNAQVLMRFTLLQLFLIPLLFTLFMKVR